MGRLGEEARLPFHLIPFITIGNIFKATCMACFRNSNVSVKTLHFEWDNVR